jgi:hypothetical protein
MCEKAGTAAGGGAGGAAWLGTAGVAVAAAPAALAAGVGAGVGWAGRLASWAWWSSKSRPDSAARGRVALVDFGGVWPSTIVIGMAAMAPAPTTRMAIFSPSNLMTRLTRSGAPVLRIARCVTQPAGESICRVQTLY